MNFLKFNKYLQSDNDGTFWPGYIEIPDDEAENITPIKSAVDWIEKNS